MNRNCEAYAPLLWRGLFGIHFFGRHDAVWSDDWFYIYETETGYGRDIAPNTDVCGPASHCFEKRGIRSVIRASRARKNCMSYLGKWLGDMVRLALLRLDHKRYGLAYRLAWNPLGESVVILQALGRRFLGNPLNSPCVDVGHGNEHSVSDFDAGCHGENFPPNETSAAAGSERNNHE